MRSEGLYTYGTNFSEYGSLFYVIVIASGLNTIMLMMALVISVRIKRKITAIGGAVPLVLIQHHLELRLARQCSFDLRLTDTAMVLVPLNPVESTRTLCFAYLTTDPSQLGMSGLIAMNVLGSLAPPVIIVSRSWVG